MKKLIEKLCDLQKLCYRRQREGFVGHQITDAIIKECIAEVFEETEVDMVFEMLYELNVITELKERV